MNFINVFLLICCFCVSSTLSASNTLAEMEAKVNLAIQGSTHWDGPIDGPKITRDKNLIFVASDMRNGGVNSVAKGLSEAISHLSWNLRFLDGLGSEVRQGAAIRKAISFQPDGIILGGIDAARHENVLRQAVKLGITIIGWHASDIPAGDEKLGLFTNITTDPLSVAEMAAQLAIVKSQGKAQVVIFTDPNYSIASIKANRMINAIQNCHQCKLLAVKEVPLDETAKRMPLEVSQLMTQYPNQITHFLVINDLYIDFATPTLESFTLSKSKHHIPTTISAGDGSQAAYERISKNTYQLATVPEPLNLQGWQIVDEMNRAFHQHPPSGYSAPVHLVTKSNVAKLMNRSKIYDPDNGYRDAYLRIWLDQ